MKDKGKQMPWAVRQLDQRKGVCWFLSFCPPAGSPRRSKELVIRMYERYCLRRGNALSVSDLCDTIKGQDTVLWSCDKSCRLFSCLLETAKALLTSSHSCLLSHHFFWGNDETLFWVPVPWKLPGHTPHTHSRVWGAARTDLWGHFGVHACGWRGRCGLTWQGSALPHSSHLPRASIPAWKWLPIMDTSDVHTCPWSL